MSLQGIERPAAARPAVALGLAHTLRKVNRRLAARSGLDVAPLACECVSRDCAAAFEVPLHLFRLVDARQGFFLVSPGHEQAELDRVVRREPSYLVVERRPGL